MTTSQRNRRMARLLRCGLGALIALLALALGAGAALAGERWSDLDGYKLSEVALIGSHNSYDRANYRFLPDALQHSQSIEIDARGRRNDREDRAVVRDAGHRLGPQPAGNVRNRGFLLRGVRRPVMDDRVLHPLLTQELFDRAWNGHGDLFFFSPIREALLEAGSTAFTARQAETGSCV